MISTLTHDFRKKARFARSVLRRRLIHVNLQILYTCNYRCSICDFWRPPWHTRPLLPVADAEVISEKLSRIGPQIISIGGGEPMLHPQLVDIVRVLARHHFPVMITNGSLVTRELARALFNAGMVEISVSLDYADPQKHDAQRGSPGAYAKAIEALQLLQASRTHPEQRVNLISVILDDNLSDLEPLIRLCREFGITFLVTLYSQSRGSKAQRAPGPDASAQLLDLKRRYRHFVALRDYLARFSEAIAGGGIGPCYAGRNLCNIDSQGDVTLCIDRLGEPLGNLLTDDVFEVEQRLLERYRSNNCRDCWTSCRGSIESLLYGKHPLLNLLDYFQMTRPVALKGAF